MVLKARRNHILVLIETHSRTQGKLQKTCTAIVHTIRAKLYFIFYQRSLSKTISTLGQVCPKKKNLEDGSLLPKGKATNKQKQVNQE